MNNPQKKYRLDTVSKYILLEGLNQFQGANLTLIGMCRENSVWN